MADGASIERTRPERHVGKLERDDQMFTRRLGPAIALATAALAMSAGPAVADGPPAPGVAYAGQLVAGPGATTVSITYTCTSETPGSVSHLFVAVKQGPNVNETTNTSSSSADTFYSTNWKSDAGPNALNCDGVEHTQTIVLKPQPGFEASVPRLHSGQALVQLCLYDNVTQFGEYGEPLDGGFAGSYTMEQVQAGHGLG
jgi:hypothetical protein